MSTLFCVDVPEFPQNESIISVINATYSTIAIKWQKATTLPIAAVTRYIIHVYDYNGLNGIYSTNDGNTLNFTVKELQSSTQYYINIIAVNIIGQSSPTTNTSIATKTFSKHTIYLLLLYIIYCFLVRLSPPTKVHVCVSFDSENNPTLHIEWKVSN